MSVERLLGAQQLAAGRGTVLAELIAARLGITPTDLKCVHLLSQGSRTARALADAAAHTQRNHRCDRSTGARRVRDQKP
jgi:hypothetical protein